MPQEKYYPTEQNLGKNCLFWQGIELIEGAIGSVAVGCKFPKVEIEGRTSCEGMIDDVCLFILRGRKPGSLTQEEIDEIRTRIPGVDKNNLPPGNIY